MRESRFWELMEDEFGSGYAHVVADRQVLEDVGSRTAIQAMGAGVPTARIWAAVCEAMAVPPERRLGIDRPARADVDPR